MQNSIGIAEDRFRVAVFLKRSMRRGIEVRVPLLCAEKQRKQVGDSLVAAGGVSANRQLRESLNHMVTEIGGRVYYPRPEYCTDNGAMIAYAGYLHLREGKYEPLSFAAHPRWSLA